MLVSTRPARAGFVRVAPWQRQRLGDADRRRIMEAARRLERQTHQSGMHGGALRRTGILVLWTLLYRGPSKHGVCDPSLGQLAAWSGCARSTVQLAIARTRPPASWATSDAAWSSPCGASPNGANGPAPICSPHRSVGGAIPKGGQPKSLMKRTRLWIREEEGRSGT
jgi:hypothetical protein